MCVYTRGGREGGGGERECALSCSTIKGFASLQRAYLLGHGAPEDEVEAVET